MEHSKDVEHSKGHLHVVGGEDPHLLSQLPLEPVAVDPAQNRHCVVLLQLQLAAKRVEISFAVVFSKTKD